MLHSVRRLASPYPQKVPSSARAFCKWPSLWDAKFNNAPVYYEQALAIKQAVDDRRGESLILLNLSLLYHHLGDNEKACDYGQQVVKLNHEIKYHFFELDFGQAKITTVSVVVRKAP